MRVSRGSVVCFTTAMMILSAAGCGGQPPADTPAGGLRPLPVTARGGQPPAAICYGPHRDGQRPGGPSPSVDELRADLHLIAAHWSVLRLYGSQELARPILEVIRADDLPLQVMLGVWIAAEETRDEQGAVRERFPDAVEFNRRESEAAIALADAFPGLVVAVCVGNETQVAWSPYPSPLDLLIGHVRRVRAAVKVPVTSADDYQYWIRPESRELARELDFVTTHAHPLWNGQQLADALPWLQTQLAAVQEQHPDRPVVIGETGWATSVAPVGEQARLIKGEVGEAQQAAFYHAARAWADSARVLTFIFEAFDENWKGGDHPAEVEKHWRLLRADRTPKAALGG